MNLNEQVENQDSGRYRKKCMYTIYNIKCT